MIRELLLVGRVSWPEGTPDIPDVDFGTPIDVKPIAWPVTAGMSHRAYLLLLTSDEYQRLAKHKRVKGVTRRHAGTKAKPVSIDDVLASVGLERGEDNG